jgi:hypothetical protein
MVLGEPLQQGAKVFRFACGQALTHTQMILPDSHLRRQIGQSLPPPPASPRPWVRRCTAHAAVAVTCIRDRRWQPVPVSDPHWPAALGTDDGRRLHGPAKPSTISDTESALGVTLPEGLRALYLATDGVFDEPGQWFPIWPLAKVIARNQAAWADGTTTRRGLLAFGDDGTGAPFCVLTGGKPGVFFWDPLLDEATFLAPSLPSFWDAWSNDSLPLH